MLQSPTKNLFGSPTYMYASEIAKRMWAVGLWPPKKKNRNYVESHRAEALEFLHFFEENISNIAAFSNENEFKELADTWFNLADIYYTRSQKEEKARYFKEVINNFRKFQKKFKQASEEYKETIRNNEGKPYIVLKTNLALAVFGRLFLLALLIGLIWMDKGVNLSEGIAIVKLIMIIGIIIIIILPANFRSFYCSRCKRKLPDKSRSEIKTCKWCNAEFTK